MNNNQEVIQESLAVLEDVNFENLPEYLQEAFIQAHMLLMNIEGLLEDN